MKQIPHILFLIMILYAPVPAVGNDPAALETVALQLRWYHQFQFAGYYAALDQGFYREAGLSVEIREGNPKNDSVTEVIEGRAEYGVSNSEALLRRLRGEPVVMVAAIFQHSPLVFVTLTDTGIRHPQDMIGRRVGVSKSTRDAELLAMLQNEGVSPDDILPPLGGKFSLFMYYDGSADVASAYISNEPFWLEQKGLPYRVISPLNYGIDFYGDCLISSEAELNAHPERSKAFREASLRGWEYAMSHQKEMTEHIIRKYGSWKSRAHLLYEAQKMEELILPKLVEIGHMNQGRWKHIADTFVKLKMAEPDYSLKGFLYDPDPQPDIARFRRFITVLLLVLLVAGCGMFTLLYFNRRLRKEIREREQAEKQLRFQAELMDQIQDTIVATDTEGRMTYINQAVARFLGKPKEELIGKTVHVLSNTEEADVLQEIIDNTLSQGFWQGNICNYARDGSRHILETRTWLVRDPAEGVSGMIGVSTDITDREQMAEDLVRALEAANAANKAKSEFLANMSHEIRTPMNAILGFSEILLNRNREAQDQHYLNAIRSSGRALLSLINDILDLSKIEAGKMEIRQERVDINSIFSEIKTFFSEKLREKGLEFRTEISEDMPRQMLLDEVRLRQVLINLVGNALKFTSQGHVRMSAFLQSSPLPENSINLILEVEDTGIGIPEDQQELIFGSFQQQKEQSLRRYGGTGLGLAISSRLAEIMKGRLAVESKPGKGSIFRLFLHDVAVVGKSPESGEHIISDRQKDVPVQFRNAGIMVVDDGVLNRELVIGYLEDSGLSVTEAENGEQALHLLGSGNIPDLILMDLKMPGKDGYEVTEILRSDERYRKIPVIACTAAAMKEDEERIAGLFDAFLRKPLGKKQLISQLKYFLPCLRKEIPVPETAVNPPKGFSEESKARLPELIRILEEDFMPVWKENSECFFMDTVTEFAEKLRKTAKEYQAPILEDYGQDVFDAAEQIHIDRLEGLMRRFPELIEELRAFSE